MTPLSILILAILASCGVAVALFKKYYLPPVASFDTTPPPDQSFIPASVPAPGTPPEAPKQPVAESMAQKVYNVAKLSLGQHLSVNPNVPEEEGCANAVSYILRRAGYLVPPLGLPTVEELIAFMLSNGFQEVKQGTAGCVVTAHNPDPAVTTFAHTGIVMEYGIASNDSRPAFLGKFLENYLGGTTHWEAYFTAHGSVTRYFLPV